MDRLKKFYKEKKKFKKIDFKKDREKEKEKFVHKVDNLEKSFKKFSEYLDGEKTLGEIYIENLKKKIFRK